MSFVLSGIRYGLQALAGNAEPTVRRPLAPFPLRSAPHEDIGDSLSGDGSSKSVSRSRLQGVSLDGVTFEYSVGATCSRQRSGAHYG